MHDLRILVTQQNTMIGYTVHTTHVVYRNFVTKYNKASLQ